MACGYIGLVIDEFYKLTPRQFHNIQVGFYRRKEDELKEKLILNRGLKFSFLQPYFKDKSLTEEKAFPLYFEKETSVLIDLQKEIEIIEDQKENFWSKIDAMKIGEA